MNEIIGEYILPISVLLTFFGTFYNIRITRKNIKTSKYIDTITSERIKWLGIIRDDVTNIITNIHFTLKIYSEKIQNLENENINHEDDIDSLIEGQSRYNSTTTSSALGIKKDIWSQSDFIMNLNLFKLRLNPNENKALLDLIEYFIKFYTESESKNASEIIEAKGNVNKLVFLTQNMLKQEWEKVKKESKGKIS